VLRLAGPSFCPGKVALGPYGGHDRLLLRCHSPGFEKHEPFAIYLVTKIEGEPAQQKRADLVAILEKRGDRPQGVRDRSRGAHAGIHSDRCRKRPAAFRNQGRQLMHFKLLRRSRWLCFALSAYSSRDFFERTNFDLPYPLPRNAISF
jgi:hypothetical protein